MELVQLLDSYDEIVRFVGPDEQQVADQQVLALALLKQRDERVLELGHWVRLFVAHEKLQLVELQGERVAVPFLEEAGRRGKLVVLVVSQVVLVVEELGKQGLALSPQAAAALALEAAGPPFEVQHRAGQSEARISAA